MNKIIIGDCLIKLKELEDNSVDSIVTDPPYHLVSIVKRFGGKNSRNTPSMETKEGGVFARKAKGFMGKEWDGVDENGIGIAMNVEMWAECLRVLKPGGHLLAFSGTRTYHRMAVAIEDAGFEVRDMIEWCYGSGFPKSLNIGKAVDKLQGNEREILSTTIRTTHKKGISYKWANGNDTGICDNTKRTSEWEGWGTALKPAHEPICLARKPLSEKTVAENVLKYGTGGINIDESRVDVADSEKEHFEKEWDREQSMSAELGGVAMNKGLKAVSLRDNVPTGRFPANFIHDNSEEVRECFPETGKSSIRPVPKKDVGDDNARQFNDYGAYKPKQYKSGINDNGGNASRFFKSIIYQAKSSKSDRNSNGAVKNIHPTCKPTLLMSYLIKMVTPKGGIVLDPFAGSFSTGVACVKNGFGFIGIEREEEYIKIGKARMEQAEKEKNKLDNQPKLL